MNRKNLDQIFQERDEPINENFGIRVTKTQLQRIKTLKTEAQEKMDRRVVQDVFRYFVDRAADELELRLRKHGA